MIWSNQTISKLVADNARFSPLPDQLLNKKFVIWDMDIADKTKYLDPNIEWNQFVKGQSTIHTYWNKAEDGVVGTTFDGRILLNSVEYGNDITTFDGTFQENNTISVLVGEEEFASLKREFPDIHEKFITLAGNNDEMFLGKLFPAVYDLDGAKYGGKIELVNIKFAIEELNGGMVGLPINIKKGQFGETIYLPELSYDKVNLKEIVKVIPQVNLVPAKMEVYIPEAAATLGVDVIKKDYTRYKDAQFSTETTKFPKQPEGYSILPTQFKVFSVDNYGISNEADITNSIRALMFTEALETGIFAGTKTAADKSTSVVGGGFLGAALGTAANLITKSGSMGSKFFGNRAELSTAPAISTRQIKNDASLLKIFIEPSMAGTSEVTSDYKLSIAKQDPYEINRSKGTAEQSLTPLLPDGFNPKQELGGMFKSLISKTDTMPGNVIKNGIVQKTYNMLGTANLANKLDSTNYNVGSEIEWLRVPNPANAQFKFDDAAFNDFMSYGSPRRFTGGKVVGPMYSPDNWETYIRSNHFRPDAYSWWNWPMLYPANLVNVYRETNTSNSISYDTAAGSPVQQSDHWTQGILVGRITDSDGYGKRDNFTSYSIDGLDVNLDQIQTMCVTASEFIIKVLDADGNEEEYRFNSEGNLAGTAAEWNNIFKF